MTKHFIISRIKMATSAYIIAIVGMTIAGSALIVTQFCLDMAEQSMMQNFDQSQIHDISLFYQHHKTNNAWEQYYEKLSQISHIKSIAPIHHRRINQKGQSWHLISTPKSIINAKIQSGRTLHPNDQQPYALAYLPEKFKQQLPEYFIEEDLIIEIIGTSTAYHTPLFLKTANPIMQLSSQTFERVYGQTPPNVVIIRYDSTANIEKVTESLDTLNQQFKSSFSTHVFTLAEMIQTKKKSIALMQYLAYAIITIISALSGISLFNLNQALYLKRRPEIALRMAVGASKKKIYQMLLMETWACSIISTVIASIISAACILVLANQFNWHFSLSFWLILKAFTLTSTIGILSSWLPAKQSFSIPIAQILKGA